MRTAQIMGEKSRLLKSVVGANPGLVGKIRDLLNMELSDSCIYIIIKYQKLPGYVSRYRFMMIICFPMV